MKANTVLETIDSFKKDSGNLPNTLELNLEQFRDLHSVIMLPVEDTKLSRYVNDSGLRTKVNHLSRIRVNPASTVPAAFQ